MRTMSLEVSGKLVRGEWDYTREYKLEPLLIETVEVGPWLAREPEIHNGPGYRSLFGFDGCFRLGTPWPFVLCQRVHIL